MNTGASVATVNGAPVIIMEGLSSKLDGSKRVGSKTGAELKGCCSAGASVIGSTKRVGLDGTKTVGSKSTGWKPTGTSDGGVGKTGVVIVRGLQHERDGWPTKDLSQSTVWGKCSWRLAKVVWSAKFVDLCRPLKRCV